MSNRMVVGALVAAAGGVVAAQPIDLDTNWNGMVHPGEQGVPTAPAGYRSISDRGLLLGDAATSIGGATYTVALGAGGGRAYAIESAADVVDIVFVGSKAFASVPSWDTTGGTGTLATATSTFAPVSAGNDFALGLLFQASNGGGNFDLTLGFTDGTSVTARINARDWFANNDPGAGAPGQGVAFQAVVPGPLSGGDGWAGTEGTDNANNGAPLTVTEVNLTRTSILNELGFDVAGRQLSSLSVTDVSINGGLAVIAASTFSSSLVEQSPNPLTGILVAPTPVLPTGAALVDENGKDFFGNDPLGPGRFPDVVVSGKWEIARATDPTPFGRGVATYELPSDEANYAMVETIISGPAPFYWTSGATNNGDLDANIGANPDVVARNGGRFYLPFGDAWSSTTPEANGAVPFSTFQANGFQFANLGFDGVQKLAEPNYGWAAGFEAGMPFIVPAENGRDDNGTFFGVEIGTLHGTAGASFGGRTGKGYSMVDGRMSGIRGGETSARTATYLGVSAAGIVSEWMLDVATIWFSYAQGWTGGLLDSATAFRVEGATGGNSVILRSPYLNGTNGGADTAGIVTDLTPGFANIRINLPGERNNQNGMLFIGTTDGNDRTIVNTFATADGGWELVGHKDTQAFGETTGETSADWSTFGSDIYFLYMPYATPNLDGGMIAEDGTVVASSTNGRGFTVTRTGTGTYSIAISGETGESGVLMLQGMDDLPTNPSIPGRTFFSYEYDAASNAFVVEARVVELGGNAAGEAYPLVDAPFSFAYVDFDTPPVASLADVNGDAILDIFDILGFFDVFASFGADLNNDGFTDIFDIIAYFDIFGRGL